MRRIPPTTLALSHGMVNHILEGLDHALKKQQMISKVKFFFIDRIQVFQHPTIKLLTDHELSPDLVDKIFNCISELRRTAIFGWVLSEPVGLRSRGFRGSRNLRRSYKTYSGLSIPKVIKTSNYKIADFDIHLHATQIFTFA